MIYNRTRPRARLAQTHFYCDVRLHSDGCVDCFHHLYLCAHINRCAQIVNAFDLFVRFSIIIFRSGKRVTCAACTCLSYLHANYTAFDVSLRWCYWLYQSDGGDSVSKTRSNVVHSIAGAIFVFHEIFKCCSCAAAFHFHLPFDYLGSASHTSGAWLICFFELMPYFRSCFCVHSNLSMEKMCSCSHGCHRSFSSNKYRIMKWSHNEATLWSSSKCRTIISNDTFPVAAFVNTANT